MISTLNVIIDEAGKELLLTAGADKKVKVHEIGSNNTLTLRKELDFDAVPRSLDYQNKKLLVGLENGTIKEF